MNRKYLSTLTLVLATLAAGNALAADAAAPKTRDQVNAELAEAVRTGDMVAHGDTGKKLNELFPGHYPAQAETQGLSRAQVLAELAEARRTGDLAADGDSGKKLNELYPGHYPAPAARQGLSRAQVLAALTESKRSGEFASINLQGDH